MLEKAFTFIWVFFIELMVEREMGGELTLKSITKPVSHTSRIRKASAFVLCVLLCSLRLRMPSQLA